MKGLSFAEFYEKLFYGADVDFAYGSLYFHISSGSDENKNHGITVCEYDKHPDEEPSYYKEIYNASSKDTESNVNSFLESAVFNGKSIREIESEITIIYS